MIYKDFFSNQKTGNGFQRFFEGLKTFNDSGKLLFLAGIFMLSGIVTAQTESEPNNDSATADVIAFGATGTGAIDAAGDVDFWKVVLPSDGAIQVNFSSTNGEYIYATLFSSDLSVNLAQTYTSSNGSISRDGLAAGTYFVRMTPMYSSGTPSYTINPVHIPITQANDTEPNNVFTEAEVLELNSTTTGHNGYSQFNGTPVDEYDWYAVTTDADGKLEVTFTSLNGQYVYYSLYDGDGTTQLASSYTSTSGTISKDGLAPGTYYILIDTFYSTSFAPYTLENNLIVPSNETEPDYTNVFENGFEDATPIAVNSTTNGHIGYRYNGVVDDFDWYAVTTDADGKLEVTFTSLNGQYVYYSIYDGDGTTQLASSYTSSTGTISKDGLAPGTYYILIDTFYSTNFAPYTLENSLVSPVTPEDENDDANDEIAGALSLPLNTPEYGHIGYRYMSDRDDNDWYELVWPETGDLRINFKSLNGEYIYFHLYNSDGSSQIAGSYTSGSGQINRTNLAAGTYLVRIWPLYSTGFGPYRISTGIDTDDDGYADVVDCDPEDSTIWQEGTFYLDEDGDGYHGSSEVLCYGEEAPEGYTTETSGFDCNDNNSAIYPGAEEICDGIDNNCNNQIDEGVQTAWYLDDDGDSYGNPAQMMMACEQPEGYVTSNTDCNDEDAAINPGASEIPGNDIDENCDGEYGSLPDDDGDGVPNVDDNCSSVANADQADLDDDGLGDACDNDADGDGFTNDVDCDDMDASIGLGEMWYADADGDGFGDAAVSMTACTQPAGYVADNTDCNDANASVYPGATEILGNGIDENCDGADGTLPDSDGDGIADVDDNCPTIANADQADLDDDGLGDACDDDADGDGYANDVDCGDMDASIGLGEMWYADADGDGFGDENTSMQACTQPSGYVADNTDCDDSNSTIYPGAAEIADDGIDQDCDGSDLTEDEECMAPAGVVVTRLSATTASFTADDTSAAYQGSANRAGRPLRPYPMYGMDNISSGHVQSGLVPQFEYDIWFRTICTDGTFTEWVGPFFLPVHTGVAKVSDVKLTPNPAVQMVKVDGMKVNEFTVFDQYGRLVLATTSDSNEFNVSKLQSGVYTVQLKGDNDEMSVQQLIKK